MAHKHDHHKGQHLTIAQEQDFARGIEEWVDLNNQDHHVDQDWPTDGMTPAQVAWIYD